MTRKMLSRVMLVSALLVSADAVREHAQRRVPECILAPGCRLMCDDGLWLPAERLPDGRCVSGIVVDWRPR